jgi:heme/copper-type cytochrome/quinol oxidase subunit 1
MGLWSGIYYYYPKITGRLMSETLGNWHFWLAFIGINLTFMPMHWSGLYGMPRRIYTYDAGQGWDTYNLLSSLGAYIQALAWFLGFWNIWRSRRKGAIAGPNPWGAPSLEWSIPSPPPEYNYAVIPTVTSRYPLWNLGGHGAPTGELIPASDATKPNPVHIPTADELGIPIPFTTIKPLFVALFMTLMFGSLMLIHEDKLHLSVVLVISFALLMTLSLYAWLTSPLEPAHH